jgi:hypothetical protein
MGTLAHEALHATAGVMLYCGMVWKNTSQNPAEEAYTYCLDWIVRTILKEFK